jgi:hypothetical protein
MLLLWPGLSSAQNLRIYSEFRRVDPFGKIVSADRGGRVREVLSPAVARNSYTSFRIAVSIPPDTPTWLYIQQNPEKSFGVNLYREQYIKAGKEWIPDGLQRVKAPCFLILPEAGSGIPKQTTQSYWLDLWVPADTPVGRVRVQAVAKIGEDWLQYPLEVRVLPALVTREAPRPARIGALSAPADASLRTQLCGAEGPRVRGTATVRYRIARNALQDRQLMGDGQSPPCEVTGDPEWFLAFRRSLYTAPPE